MAGRAARGGVVSSVVMLLDSDRRLYKVAIPRRLGWRWQLRYAVETRDGPAVSTLVVSQHRRRVRAFRGWAPTRRAAIWCAERAIGRAAFAGAL
jgi:hypothetical protein